MHARLLHEESSSNPRISGANAARRAAVAVTVNIAFRPRSGDLILMNAGLAKPIPQYLVYSKARRFDAGSTLLRRGPVRQVPSASAAVRQGWQSAAGNPAAAWSVPACRSIPSGSQPVQRQSAGSGAEQPGRVEIDGVAMIGVHVVDGVLLRPPAAPRHRQMSVRNWSGLRSTIRPNPATRWAAVRPDPEERKILKIYKGFRGRMGIEVAPAQDRRSRIAGLFGTARQHDPRPLQRVARGPLVQHQRDPGIGRACFWCARPAAKSAESANRRGGLRH